MKRALYHILAICLCRQIKAQDSEKQLAQQLIDHIRTSDLASWISLAVILSTAFEIDNTSSTSQKDHYNSARKKALHWLSTDDYALTLAKAATSNNNDESIHKQTQLLQRYALATIYYSTSQNEEWSSCAPDPSTTPCDHPNHRFLSSADHLSWDGINGKSGLITWLDLNTKNLSNCPSADTTTAQTVEYDALPMELTLLSPTLELLWIHSNPLCGSLPSYIGEFQTLQSLSAYSTNISGSLPDSMYEIEKLASVRLYKSNFSGGIDEKIAKLKNLKWFWIHENRFTGRMPDWSGLTALEGITLHGNLFADNDSSGSLCPLLKGNLKYLWTDCSEGSIVKEGEEWVVVEGMKACDCCTRCFPREDVEDAVA